MSATDYSQDRSWRAGQSTTPLRRDGSTARAVLRSVDA